jgi:hypothetical protein
MQKVICMEKIKFQQQEAKNKQKILHDIYIYITNLTCPID